MGETLGYLIGNDIPRFTDDSLTGDPIIAVTSHGEEIGRPAGDFSFAYTNTILDKAGRLHVLWVEPEGTELRTGRAWARASDKWTDLWHVVFDQQGGWGTPKNLYHGSRLRWDEGRANVATDIRGRVHVVLVENRMRLSERAMLVHLVWDSGTWSLSRVPIDNYAVGAPSLAIGGEGQLYVAFLAPDRTAGRDANSVFLRRSLDGGHSWEPSRLVSRSGLNRAFEVSVFALGDESVQLVWAQDITGDLNSDVIRHVSSVDQGLTWSSAADLDVEDGFFMLQAEKDDCNTIHIIYRTLSESGHVPSKTVSYLWYARWDGGWITPVKVFPSFPVLDSRIVMGSSCKMYLFSSVKAEGRISSDIWTPMLSELSYEPCHSLDQDSLESVTQRR
ncbi:MAG: hypothetical protein ACREK5_04820 [Gemmatimonadota bacterium]